MKTDARVRYTKRVIRDSLLHLLKEKPIQKITVKEICERAEINRATFYTHYRDPFDLLEQVEDELFEDISASVIARLGSIDDITKAVFAVIDRNMDLCRVLFESGDKGFLTRIMDVAREQAISDWRARYPHAAPQQLDYLYTFLISGSVAVIEQWVRTGTKEIPLDLGNFAKRASDLWLRDKRQ